MWSVGRARLTVILAVSIWMWVSGDSRAAAVGLAAPPGAAPAPSPRAPVASEAGSAEARPCKKDLDCAAVPADCCGCAQGGAARAVSKKHAAAYERARRTRCGGVMCTEVMSLDPSCAKAAVCDAGACRLGAAPSPAASPHSPPSPAPAEAEKPPTKPAAPKVPPS